MEYAKPKDNNEMDDGLALLGKIQKDLGPYLDMARDMQQVFANTSLSDATVQDRALLLAFADISKRIRKVEELLAPAPEFKS